MKCLLCKFWANQLDDKKGDPLFGECRRYPPSQKQSGQILLTYTKDAMYGMDVSQFEIITYKDDWCGEYKPRGRSND
jgi:hypothetical protein